MVQQVAQAWSEWKWFACLDKRSRALLQFVLLRCLDWKNISACLSSIIAPLFPNLHTVGVFKGLLGDPFIAKLASFSKQLIYCT